MNETVINEMTKLTSSCKTFPQPLVLILKIKHQEPHPPKKQGNTEKTRCCLGTIFLGIPAGPGRLAQGSCTDSSEGGTEWNLAVGAQPEDWAGEAAQWRNPRWTFLGVKPFWMLIWTQLENMGVTKHEGLSYVQFK